MKVSTPVEELKIKEIRNNLLKKQDEILSKTFEEKRMKFIKSIGKYSLYDLANNKNGDLYRPYLIDFGFIMDRLQDDLEIDQSIESIQVKLDITEQLEKIKELPSFDTKCHIESKNVYKSTNIISFIRKFIFRQKKYRVIFHKNVANFDKVYYKVNNLPFMVILCCMFASLLLSIIHNISFLSLFSTFCIICVSIIWFICL